MPLTLTSAVEIYHKAAFFSAVLDLPQKLKNFNNDSTAKIQGNLMMLNEIFHPSTNPMTPFNFKSD